MPFATHGSSQKPLDDIEDILGVIKEERNRYTVENLKELQLKQPGSFTDDDVLRVGTRVFKNFETRDLKKIEKAYQRYSIIDASPDLVAEAGIYAYSYLKTLTQNHIITGEYDRSIGIFIRSIGGIDREIPPGTLSADALPTRPVVTIIPDTAYANKLETLVHHGQIQGFLYHTSKMVKNKYGRDVDVKYDYFSATRLGSGYKGGSLPRIQISQPGNIKGSSDRPGFSKKRSRRR